MSSEKHKIVIFSHEDSPRLRYVLKHIFTQFWETDFHLEHEHKKVDGVAIAYGSYAPEIDSLIRIPQSSLLFEQGINQQALETKIVSGLPTIFCLPQHATDYDLQFDVFAFVFFHLSRYEEYLPGKKDEHGRYQSSNSWSSQNTCLDKPIVDLMILQLGEVISKKFGIHLIQKGEFQIIPSFDIDMPFAYKYKGYKAYAGIFRDLLSGNFGGVKDRCKYWYSDVDPFDRYALINELCSDQENSYCFLLQNWGPPFDLNHVIKKTIWGEIIIELTSCNHIGIHPSYNSYDAITKLEEEIRSLENLSDQKVFRSRQHFLRLKFPDTYRQLLEMGIREDHSMIYPDQIGFRAGTAQVFYWYDLQVDQETNLKVYSYSVMDATLRYYMGLSPEEAVDVVYRLKNQSSHVRGNFGFIWHNSSMSRAYGWAKWQKVLRACFDTSLFPNR